MSQLDQIQRHRARRALAATAAALVLALGVAACGNDDDGADVRSSGPGASGSGSGSASGSGSGSASASAPASGSGVAIECQAIDGTNGVADADSTVAATLDEFVIALDPATTSAGAVGFVAENIGEEPHEIVIARGVPDDITVVDGAPDEAALGDALIGEIEAFAAGQTCEGTYELEAGDYVLFCALVEEEADGMIHSHYEEGMFTALTVS